MVMDIEDLEEQLSNFIGASNFNFKTDKLGRLIIQTNLVETPTGELVDFDSYPEQAEDLEEFDIDVDPNIDLVDVDE